MAGPPSIQKGHNRQLAPKSAHIPSPNINPREICVNFIEGHCKNWPCPRLHVAPPPDMPTMSHSSKPHPRVDADGPTVARTAQDTVSQDRGPYPPEDSPPSSGNVMLGPKPSRQSLRPGDICPHYARGQCRWERCKYLHVDPGQGGHPQPDQRRHPQQQPQSQRQQPPQQPPFQQPQLPQYGPPGLPGPNIRNIYTQQPDNLCVTSLRPPSPIHQEGNVPVIRLPRGTPSAPAYASNRDRPPLQNVQAHGRGYGQAYTNAYPLHDGRMPPQVAVPPRFQNLAPRHAFMAPNPGELVPETIVPYTKTEGGAAPQRRERGLRPRDATISGGVGSGVPTNLPAPPPREQVPDLSSEGSSASDSSIADIDVPASLAASPVASYGRAAREVVGAVGGGNAAIVSTQRATNLDKGDAGVVGGPRRGQYTNGSEVIPEYICRDWYFRNNCTRGAQCRWRHEKPYPDGGQPSDASPLQSNGGVPASSGNYQNAGPSVVRVNTNASPNTKSIAQEPSAVGSSPSARQDASSYRSNPRPYHRPPSNLPFGLCWEWNRTRTCKDGPQCRWAHRFPNADDVPAANDTTPGVRNNPPANSATPSRKEPSPVQRTEDATTANCGIPGPKASTGLPPLPDDKNKDRNAPPPSEEMVIKVADPTRATFGPGFQVLKVATALDSRWIAIANIPTRVGRPDLERLLKPVGQVTDVKFREDSSSTASFTNVRVQLSTHAEATAAVDSLDGVEVFGSRIRVRLAISASLQNSRLQDCYVRFNWNMPCRTGFAGYDTEKAALAAIKKADGSTLRGHWVTASMYTGLPCVGQFNVRFTGMPPNAKDKDILRYGKTSESGIMFSRPNYDAKNYGIAAVERLLKDFGRVTYFEVVPAPYKDGVVRGWARFDLPDVAKAACELDGWKQDALGGEKIHIQRVQSIIRHVPIEVFRLIKRDIDELRDSLWKFAKDAQIHELEKTSNAPGDDTIALKVVADDHKIVGQIKAKLDELVLGEVLKDDRGKVWDDWLGSLAGVAFLENMQSIYPGILMKLDRVRRTLNLVGDEGARGMARYAILNKLKSLEEKKIHIIPLQGRLIGLFMDADIIELQNKHGNDTVWFSLDMPCIRVRGDDALFEEVQYAVRRAQDRHPHEQDRVRNHCPVCFEEATTPISLQCGHTWCKSCLTGYLVASVDNRSFPLRCLGQDATCTHLVPLRTARDVLLPSQFDALTHAAYTTYVQSRPDEFFYCPTPDCSQIHRLGPKNSVMTCPNCVCRICPHCHVEYHEGATCEDRDEGIDRLFEEWKSLHDVKRCPGCKALIEKADGCHHMTCTRCKTHTCWACLETFPLGEGIYDHMRHVHGSIGL